MEMDLTPTKEMNSSIASVSSSVFQPPQQCASTPNRRTSAEDEFKKPITDATNKQPIRSAKKVFAFKFSKL